MITEDQWLRETMEIIEEWESEKSTKEDRFFELRDELDELGERISAAQKLIEAYRIKHKTELLTKVVLPLEDLSKLSYAKIIVKVAQNHQNILDVKETVEALLDSKALGTDRRNIQANVYSALKRMVKGGHFRKMGRGQYRFTNHLEPKADDHETAKPRRDRNPSGVKNAVRTLKTTYPQWTKTEVLNYLLEIKFDFKGKRPVNAVNMAWASLGYSKENKQPALPGVDVIHIPPEIVRKILPEQNSSQVERTLA